ncbi:hypothetical protein WICPIJ_008556 [Wickerhamomyces pijperi]|uniref:Uncharacterized protein n=1 Tax=Wickerhamomyces pijperi TaxID=599730 RepID=A0A9P8PYT5_WICPI|nr:hypothetical protein WICPIJ_008556 [Wickerhamomyces pijperi]
MIKGCVINVANILDKTPRTKFSCGSNTARPLNSTFLRRSYEAYVIEGFIVRTKDTFNPLQNPVIPSSLMMFLAVCKMVVFSNGSVCCFVAITETGDVKNCPIEAAMIPNSNSSIVPLPVVCLPF